ncbi:MAG: hypothetical protein K0M63_02300 [Weeksellaceae bacterium]|nr:hypothetical protein [Weeksellaceae bacterium]
MKKIQVLILLGLFMFCISCKAQTLPLNTPLWDIPANSYVKDLNNELLPYVGTYKATYQGHEITLFITKTDNMLVKSAKKNFFQDALVVKYIVKNSIGIILQDTQNINNLNIKFYSFGTDPTKNIVDFSYSGTNCNVGGGLVYLKRINATQLSWDYQPQEGGDDNCPPGTDTTVYLPDVDNLIFTKQ